MLGESFVHRLMDGEAFELVRQGVLSWDEFMIN